MATLVQPSATSAALPAAGISYHPAPSGAAAAGAARVPVALVEGDGVGPEITAAVRRVLEAAGARVDWQPVSAGRAAGGGVPREALDAVARTGLLLKGPLAGPPGGAAGPDAALRAACDAFAQVRPVRELPGVYTPLAGRGADFVIVRGNSAPAGGEGDTARPAGGEWARLARFACQLAAERGGPVTCVAGWRDDDVERLAFDEAAAEHPNLAAAHLPPDAAAHEMALRPARLGVVLAAEPHGAALSAAADDLAGGVAVAATAHFGPGAAIFEPAHGPAPRIAGSGVANPLGMLYAATMLLRHVGDPAAERVEAAVARTLRAGFHTLDLGGASAMSLCTSAFADAVAARIEAPPAAAPAR